MATGDPRIRYDILANAEGEEDVARLASELEKLDEAVDPRAAAQAKALAEEIRALAEKRAAVEAFLRALADTTAAERGLEGAQQALQKLERRLEGVEKPTRAQVGQLNKLRDAAQRAQTQFTESNSALNASRASMDRLGLSTKNLGVAQEQLDGAVRRTRAEIAGLVAGYQKTATAAAASAAAQQRSHRSIGDGVRSISSQLNQLQRLSALAVGGGIFGGLIRDAASTADAYSNLAARIRLVTETEDEFQQAFDGVFDVALRTNSSLEETGTLFVRIAQAGKALGLSQREALALTETINQAIQLSGGSADSARAAITQLIQGLQSGVLRGEEFNSVMEQSPRLAQALANGLGVTTGELRKLAQQGQLTTETVIRGLQGQSAAVQREFAQLPPTVGRALQNLSTEWTRYIGEVDKANGISAGAAQAIGFLAQNLNELGTALEVAGKGWIAYRAFDLARLFLAQAGALQQQVAAQAAEARARTVATGALAANTAATAANTTAKTANAAATAAAATAQTSANTAGAAATAGLLQRISLLGRLTGAVGLAATAVLAFGDIAVSAFRSVGTFIGEGIAKLQGYKDKAAELAEVERARADAAQQAARADAALAQSTRQAQESAIGLTAASKALIGEFDAVIQKGDATSAALEKVSKSLRLDDITGIQAAATALDELGRRGAITATQVTETLGAAIRDLDLGVLATQARAAFDGSEQSARRLQAVLDSIATESLRRAGTSAEELRTGFSDAANAAINDVDALAEALADLGAGSEDTGRLLAAAVDKATSTANTERAVQAVIERIIELGKQGKLSGEQVALALDGARRKVDELRPGIDSLSEAYRRFGFSTQAELQRVAAENKKAWDLIRQDATLSLAQKQTAFKQYADSAIAANRGVADSTIQAEAQTLKLAITADATGKKIVGSMAEGTAAVHLHKAAVEGVTGAYDDMGLAVQSIAAGFRTVQTAAEGAANAARGVRAPGSSAGGSAVGPGGGATSFTIDSGSFTPPNLPGDWFFDHNAWQQAGGPLPTGPNDHRFWRRRVTPGSAGGGNRAFGGPAGTPALAANAARQTPGEAARAAERIVRLDLTINGRGLSIPLPAGTSQTEALLREIEAARSAAGG